MSAYEQMPLQSRSKPGQLIAAFVIALIGLVLAFILGIFCLGGASFIGDRIPFLVSLSMSLATVGAIVLVSASIMLLLWIFTFIGKNGARITLIVIYSLNVIVGIIRIISLGTMLITFSLTNLILGVILLILLSSRSVADYCASEEMRYRSPIIEQGPNLYGPPLVDKRESVSSARPSAYEDRTISQGLTPSSFAILIAESGPLVGQTFKLIQGGSYVVGRAGDIAIPPEDKTVSREHARIRDENGKFVLYDMGSTNHTYVNEERVDRKVLLDGDKIKIGQTVFRFQWVKK